MNWVEPNEPILGNFQMVAICAATVLERQ